MRELSKLFLSNFKKLNEKKKNVIIFSCVTIFAIQTLFLIETYNISTPFADDYDVALIVYSIIENKKFPYNELITAFNQQHIPIFPRLVLIPTLLVDSFDVKNASYFGFSLMIFSIFLLYKLLKKTDPSLTWLLIPISAFIFSPLQHILFESSYSGLMWQFPLVGTITAVYLLNKDKLNNKSIVLAFFFAVIGAFSFILGLIIFIICVLSFYYFDKYRIKRLIIWIASSSLVFLLYFKDLELTPINFGSLFTIEGLSFIFRFISVPFRLKYDYFLIPLGIISLLLFFGFSLYLFLIKKKQKISLPWIQLGLMGIFSAIVTEVGKIGSITQPGRGDVQHYVMISNLSQIAILIFASLILLDIIKNSNVKRYKQTFTILFFVFVITQMILLTPSYYLGWKLANYYNDYETKQHNCFIPSNYNPEFCRHLPSWPPSKTVELYNYFLEQKLVLFSNFDLSKYNKEIFEDFPIIKESNYKTGIGTIEKINGRNISDMESIQITDPVVMITGWILDSNMQKMNSVILFVDDKPFFKHDYFIPREDIFQELGSGIDLHAGFEIGFLSGFIEYGCHTAYIAGIKDNEVYRLDQEIEICKNL